MEPDSGQLKPVAPEVTSGIGWRARELTEILGDTDNMNSFSTQISSWAARGLINKIRPATYTLN